MSQRRLILIVLFASVVLLLQFRPSYDVDLFWQVKLGQLALERGELVRADPFTSTHAGDPVAPIAWLAQVLYALLHAAGSWQLLHQVNALVFAAALLVAAWSVRDRQTSVLASLLAVCLGMLVAMPHCEIRPQSFGILGYGLLLWLVQAELRPAWKLMLAVVVLVIWQNLHPSVMLAAVTMAAWAAAGWVQWARERRSGVRGQESGGVLPVENGESAIADGGPPTSMLKSPPHPLTPSPRPPVPWLPTAMVFLTVGCATATPMGLDIFAGSKHNTEISRNLGISEWMPLWHPAALAAGAWIVWLALGVSLVLLALLVWRRKQVALVDLATFVALALVALPVYRLSLFLAVAMIPVWSRWIAEVWPAAAAEPAPGKTVRPWQAAAVGAVVLLGVLAGPRLLNTRLFDPQLPFAGIEKMHALGVRGVVYNYREWGGPLIWEGYPDWQVTIDGRLYLFTPDEWRRYEEIARGRVPVAEVEAQFRPDAFFLRPDYDRRFIQRLQESPDWKEAYADANSSVFLRR